MLNHELVSNTELLMDEIIKLREDIHEEGASTLERWNPLIERKEYLPSAVNLAAYLAIRRRDMRDIQDALSVRGLSSLGRSESRVVQTMDAILDVLSKITGKPLPDKKGDFKQEYIAGRETLERHSKEIFGEEPEGRYSRVMVTMPLEAAEDEKYVHRLIEAGMNVARINCAHDNPEVWLKMIDHIRLAEEKTGQICKVLMDIAGPKVRTKKLLTTAKNPNLGVGDAFLLTNQEILDNYYNIETVVSCNAPEVIAYLEEGDPVYVDDGMITGHVEAVKEKGVIIRVDRVLKKSVRLKTEKGLNFPTSDFKIDILTEKDKENLDFVCQHADIIGFSFIKNEDDIRTCQQEMIDRVGPEKAQEIAVMAKIETVPGVENLKDIIVAGAGKNPFSVMIARGDLAVEAGFLRLAELQEEILWICEAAHVPVIWATQVLDSMVKSGIPSRSEITDAAMGGRAECVMLNKGDYLLDGVKSLDTILKRMVDHQYKKMPLLRRLSIAEEN